MSLPVPPTIESSPRAGGDGRVAGAGVDDVVAGAADDRVVARAAGDGRVAGAGVDEVVVVVERDVVAVGRGQINVKLALERELIVVAESTSWVWPSSSSEVDRDRLGRVREVERIGPAAADHEWVVAGVDPEHGIPRAADERVVTAVGDERVVAGPADQAVGPRPATSRSSPEPAMKRLVAAVAVELDRDLSRRWRRSPDRSSRRRAAISPIGELATGSAMIGGWFPRHSRSSSSRSRS